MPHDQETLFGQIAVRERLIGPAQLQGCLAEQQAWPPGQPVPRIGELLASKGLLTADQVRTLLIAQQRQRAPIDLPGYEILQFVGRGGMGSVYRARQLSMDRIVAIKVLAAKLANDREYISRFVREARSAGKLNHPNIVQGFDVGEAGGYHYFVMEYVDGVSVKAIIERDGKISEKRALDIALQIARALKHAHSHDIIHRDVKPDNILICRDGTAKLADLGLAKSLSGDSSVTMDGRSLGTPYYASPEQAQANPRLDTRSDIYSLGATLYHMIAGTVPFDGPTPAAVMAKHLATRLTPVLDMVPTFSPAAAAIVHKAMTKDKKDRYQTPDELIEDLELAIAGKMPKAAEALSVEQIRLKDSDKLPGTEPARPGGVAPQPRARPAPQPQFRAPAVIALAAAAVLLAAGIAVYELRGKQPGTTPPPTENPIGKGTKLPKPSPPADDLEKQANALLAAARRFETDNPADTPAEIGRTIVQYQKLTSDESLAGFKASEQALKRIIELRERKAKLQADAKAALTELQQRLKPIVEQSRFGEAIAELNGFAEARKDTEAAAAASKASSDLAAQAQTAFQAIITKANELAGEAKFDEAAALFDTVLNDYGIEALATQARQHVERINGLKQQHAEQIAGEEERLRDLAEKLKGCDEQLGAFGYSRAAELLDEADKLAKIDAEREAVAVRRGDLGLLQKLHAAAIAALPQSDAERSIRRKDGSLLGGRITSTTADAVTIQPRDGPPFTFKWTALDPASARVLLRSTVAPDDTNGHLAYAVLCLHQGESDLAKTELTRSGLARSDPQAAEKLAARIEAAKAAATDRSVIELHASAKAEKDPTRALPLYARLLKDHAESRYVTDNKDAIDAELLERQQAAFAALFALAQQEQKADNKKEAEAKLKAIERLLTDGLTDKMRADIAKLREQLAEREQGMTPLQAGIFQLYSGNDAAAARAFQAAAKAGGKDAPDATRFLDAMQKQSRQVGTLFEHTSYASTLPDHYERVAALRIVCRDSPTTANNVYYCVKYASTSLQGPIGRHDLSDAALSGAAKAAGTSPWAARTLVLLGENQLDRGDVAEALAVFRQVLKKWTDAPLEIALAHVGSGRCLLQGKATAQDGLNELKMVTTKLADQPPAAALAWLALGQACEDRKQYRDAADAYERSLNAASDPEHPARIPQALLGGIKAYGKGLKDPAKARPLAERLRQQFPLYYEAHRKEIDESIR